MLLIFLGSCDLSKEDSAIRTQSLSLKQKALFTDKAYPFVFFRCVGNHRQNSAYNIISIFFRDEIFRMQISSMGQTIPCLHENFHAEFPFASPGLLGESGVAYHVFSRDELVYLYSGLFQKNQVPNMAFFLNAQNKKREYMNLNMSIPREYLMKIWTLVQSSQFERARSLLQNTTLKKTPENFSAYKKALETMISAGELIFSHKKVPQ